MDLDHEVNTRTYYAQTGFDRHALYDDRRHGHRHHRDLWPLRRDHVIRLRGIRRNDTRPAASVYGIATITNKSTMQTATALMMIALIAPTGTAATATLTTCSTIAAAAPAARRDQFRVLRRANRRVASCSTNAI